MQSITFQQDEWVVCRVFQKSAGAKKYPTSQSRTVINPYALETGPSMLPSPLMPLGDPTQFLFSARNNYGTAITTPELAELSRVFRAAAAAGGSSTTTMMNLPIPSPQFNYPAAMAGGGAPGGCLSISGLNLNLGSPPVQPVFRPLQPPPPPMNLNQHHDQIAASMISTTSGTSFALDQSGSSTGYGTDMNNVPNNNGTTIRPYMNVDHCMDLDNYWPAYQKLEKEKKTIVIISYYQQTINACCYGISIGRIFIQLSTSETFVEACLIALGGANYKDINKLPKNQGLCQFFVNQKHLH